MPCAAARLGSGPDGLGLDDELSRDHLPHSRGVVPLLGRALRADAWDEREEGLVEALRLLGRVQGRSGLPAVDDPVAPFWDRPYRGVREAVVGALEDAVSDPAVRALPRGVGSAEQWSTSVDVLVDPSRRLR